MKKNSLIITLIVLIILLLTVILLSVIKPNKVESISNCIDYKDSCKKNELSKGVKVQIKVNDSDTYDFYMIDDNDTYVTLIMDKNIGKSMYSSGDNTKGPLYALEDLNKITSKWNKIELIDAYRYDDYGYQTFESLKPKNLEKEPENPADKVYLTPGGYIYLEVNEGLTRVVSETEEDSIEEELPSKINARLITYEELDKLKVDGKHPKWLNNDEDFWTMSSYYATKNTTGNAYAFIDGELKSTKVTKSLGLRPVITVSKELILNTK